MKHNHRRDCTKRTIERSELRAEESSRLKNKSWAQGVSKDIYTDAFKQSVADSRQEHTSR